MHQTQLWVIGGDTRQRLLADLLARDGHRVFTYALGRGEGEGRALPMEELTLLGRARWVVLPVPVCREEGVLFAPLAEEPVRLETVLEAMRPGQLVLGGQLSEGLIQALRARGVRWRDYMAREELAVANAVPTAEGALQLAMETLPITLHGCRALVLGYGRVGRALARRLSALGAQVTVAARRSEQLSWARAEGCVPLPLRGELGALGEYDVLFNTVPARLLGREALAGLKPGCPVIELASAPGGVDGEAAEELGVQVLLAGGLPGRVAPLTAALALRQTLSHIMEEVPE